MTELPPIPQPWQERYAVFETAAWRGYVERALWSGEGEPPCWLKHPASLLDNGSVIRWFKRGRNRLAEVRWPGLGGVAGDDTPRSLVLKEYGAADPIARVRCFLRPPRAARGWSRAFGLLERGVSTPRPLWLALSARGRGEGRGYLAVETAPPHSRAREVLKQVRKGGSEVDLGEGRRLATEDFLRRLARFAGFLHQSGVWHRDFSGGNILIPDSWRPSSRDDPSAAPPFLLVDVNRCRLLEPGTLPVKARLQDLERVSLDRETHQRVFFEAYAAGVPELESARDLYLKRARLYRRLRQTRNPALRLWRKIFDYWLR